MEKPPSGDGSFRRLDFDGWTSDRLGYCLAFPIRAVRNRLSACPICARRPTEPLRAGPQRHHEKSREQGKLAVRERVSLLLDEGSFSEEALLANWNEDGLGADGVVTGVGTIEGRPVALMANDPTVKAGSWGPKTVEKILRIQERASSLRIPMVYLVDSAGARITEQVQMFPGRRGAGRIFFNEVRMSGVVPQVCVLFGPKCRRRRLHPGFLRHRDHARRQRFDVPGLAAHGPDGDRRERDLGGDGRGSDAHRCVRLCPSTGQERRGGDRPRPTLSLLLPDQLGVESAFDCVARAGRARRRRRRSPSSSRPTRTSLSTCSP